MQTVKEEGPQWSYFLNRHILSDVFTSAAGVEGKQGVDVQWFHLCHENLVDGQGVGSVLTDLKGRHIWFFVLK